MSTSNNDVTWQLDTTECACGQSLPTKFCASRATFQVLYCLKVWSRFCGMYYINTQMFCNTPQTGYGRYAAILVNSVIWAVNLKHLPSVQGSCSSARSKPNCALLSALQRDCNISPITLDSFACTTFIESKFGVELTTALVFTVFCLPNLKWKE